MTPKTKKIIAVVVVILIVIAIGWYLLKPASTWTIKSKQGINGELAETQGPGITVAAAKSYAESKGYAAFFIDGGGTVYYFVKLGTLYSNTGGDSYVKG